MNTKLLRKVQKHIREEPRRWSFGWILRSSHSPCGTKACIAGWTVLLGDKLDIDEGLRRHNQPNENGDCTHTSVRAKELLELTQDQAERLFLHWPYNELTLQPQFDHDKPEDAVKYIDYFIKTEQKKAPRKSKKIKDLPPATT